MEPVQASPSKILAPIDEAAAEPAVLAVVQQLADELRGRSRAGRRLTLDSSLESEAGLDSLGRVELIARLERRFGAKVAEDLFATAETPRDLVRAMIEASPNVPRPGAVRAAAAPLPEFEGFPEQATTLVEVMLWHLQRHPQRPHIHLYDEGGGEQQLSYGDLWHGARHVAAGLAARRLVPGRSVAVMIPTRREFFVAFFGILLAGGVPVPIYPPARRSQIEDHIRRQAAILRNAEVCILVTDESVQAAARLLRLQVAGLTAVATVPELCESGAAAPLPQAKPEDTALLQYTSGSTGDPKGVVLTHANLLANIRAMGQAVQATAADVFVSWLPLYHDMGLIGAWLGSLYHASLFVCMSPLRFLARPEQWLWAIHRHRGTLSAAPNFGYELCLRRIQDRDLQGLDLSSWRLAFNGAEPVSPETLSEFSARFRNHGLRPEAVAPVYGLAESSVGLAFPPLGRAPLIDRVRREPFTERGEAVAAPPEEPDALRFVACGQPLAGHEIRVVDPAGRELGERRQGRLEFRGPSASAGYYRNPDATRRLLQGGWLDSGDLAYVAEGEIYITGRAKDIVIRAGRNIYPHELEEAVGKVPGLRKGCVAVFGSRDQRSGTERLVVLAETREADPAVRERLRDRVQEVAVDVIGMPADDVTLVPPHTVPKTSSGKIRRAASREVYERGGSAQRALWWQLLRLGLSSLQPGWRRLRQQVLELLYAVYLWTVFSALAPLVWAVVAGMPRPAWSQRLVRRAARLALWLSGTPLQVSGLGLLPERGGYVMVANHASYLDGMVLMAALPVRFSFVAKKELAGSFITRVFLRQLGCQFVERFDARQGVEDARRVTDLVRRGVPVLYFPEGTFFRMPGLLPFRMGGFAAAAEQGVPVVPVALRGTRSMLRSGQWFPRRSVLAVTIAAPLRPEGDNWDAALRLRDGARDEILKHCGEPELRSPGIGS
jgi:1-acyl-sn-glycerol-3-phosphate acyltransferase